MNIEKYMVSNELSPADVVEMLKPNFPKFDKRQVSMCKNGEYGVTLSPMAVKTLNKFHPPKKENRVRCNKVTVHVDDIVYAALIDFCAEKGITKQDAIETAIYTMLEPQIKAIGILRVKLKDKEDNS